VVVDDGLLPPGFEPAVSGDVGVVGIGSSIVLSLEVVVAGRQPDPAEELLGGQLGADRPLAEVVDDFITSVRGETSDLSGLPTGFFARMFSSMSLEMTSFGCAILAFFWATTSLSLAIRASLADSAALAWRPFLRSNTSAPCSKMAACQL